jgi:hypothetical protein
MPSFVRIDEVQPSPQFGNCGPDGWGFALWGDPNCAEEVHRRLLETFSTAYTSSELRLPPWYECEDMVEGSLTWEGTEIWIWFETVLNFTSIWSADKPAILSLRAAILPFAQV